MMRRALPIIAIAVALFVVVPAVNRFVLTGVPTIDVYAICGECGLTEVEIDVMIQSKRASSLNREEQIAAWESTYDDPVELAAERDSCLPCVEAVLDAAEVE